MKLERTMQIYRWAHWRRHS